MVQIDDLPPLRAVIEKYQLNPKKSLGQNFLLDLNLTQKIARQAGELHETTVVEIGPGPGGLTRAILSLNPKKLIVIERDERCVPALEEIAQHYRDKMSIIRGDALEQDLRDFSGDGAIKIIANLPYNVGTQLLAQWLIKSVNTPYWDSMTLMFQKEVGQRIIAEPNSAHYGRLGVLCGFMSHAAIAFDVSREAFSPPPKVTSSIVHLRPRLERVNCELENLERVTQLAFGQRRKMLRQSLKALGGETLLNSVGIDPTRRAETLSIEEFCEIANAL